MRKYFKAIAAFARTKPVKFLRALFSKKSLNSLIENIYNPNQSDELKAFSAAFGIFIGITPVWGLQTIIAISFAVLLKLNKSLVVIFSQVSFPPVFPLIILLSYKAGGYWIGNSSSSVPPVANSKNIGSNIEQYLYGSITLAVVAGVVTGLLMFAWLKLVKAIKQYRITLRLKKAL
jgi:uncharacterized protein (DUF2062 family)